MAADDPSPAEGTPELLTVPQVADRFQVTAQTIRNWIDQGVLPALRVGRAIRVRGEDVDELIDRASAQSVSLATRRDVWAPTTSTLPRARESEPHASVWEDGDGVALNRR
jgi:excisionase family DNA binding protein